MRNKLIDKNKSIFSVLPIFLIWLGLVMSGMGFQAQAAFRKCQDEEGNWHYGEFADAECAQSSDVTTLSDSGTEINKEAPPPTTEELANVENSEQAAAAAATAAAKQLALDKSLVQIYGSGEVIISTRDRKLTAIDNNLEITRQLKSGIQKDIESLKARKKSKKVDALIAERELAIKSYDRVIRESLSERSKLEEEYVYILDSFRKASARLGTGG